MSKIGRKAIDIHDVQVEIKGQDVHFKGPKDAGVYTLPEELMAIKEDTGLVIKPHENIAKSKIKTLNSMWGLHRALLANKINGARKPFSIDVQIVGLGYRATQSGDKLVFKLGYSHDKNFKLPKGVSVSIDKSGQKLKLESSDKVSLGLAASELKSLRPTEPYKGRGIRCAGDIIIRKERKKKV